MWFSSFVVYIKVRCLLYKTVLTTETRQRVASRFVGNWAAQETAGQWRVSTGASASVREISKQRHMQRHMLRHTLI